MLVGLVEKVKINLKRDEQTSVLKTSVDPIERFTTYVNWVEQTSILKMSIGKRSKFGRNYRKIPIFCRER